MIDSKIGKNCTGCGACANICGLGAIALLPDGEGFVYPKVDREKCVSCGQCVAHCPSLTAPEREPYSKPQVYAAWHKDSTIRLESTSGGVFTALAEAVLERGGHVAGAYYDDEFTICHGLIHSVEQLPMLRQSKYAQSEIGFVFREIRKLLQKGETVLFCGTPCQSAGLQNYLSRKYENLYCCDFICRGVISPKVYHKFLEDMKPDRQAQLNRVHFKNKDFGWNRFSTKLTYSGQRVYQRDRNEDYYMRGYLRHNLYIRPSCHQCAYKSLPRISDISLGDFWGIGKYDKALDNEMGTSVVLVNSAGGGMLLDWAREKLVLHQRTLEEVTAGNSCLLQAAPEGPYRSYFFENMDRYPFGELIEKIDAKAERLSTKDRFLRFLYNVKRAIAGDGK